MKKNIQLTSEGISEAVKQIETELKKKKVKAKSLYKTLLSAEDIMVALAELPCSGDASYEVIDTPFRKQVIITAKGPEYENSVTDDSLNLDLDGIDSEAGERIRKKVLNSLSDRIHYNYRKGTNRIAVDFASKKKVSPMIIAIFSAIFIGLLLNFALSENISAFVCGNVLEPCSNIILSLLQLLVGPMVFLSIVTAISQYSDLSDFGHIGAKILGSFFSMAFGALLLGYSMFVLFKPGVENSFPMTEAISDTPRLTVLDTVLSIFPSNAISSFYHNNMPQIILLAVLIGIVTVKMKTFREPILDLFNGLNEVIGQAMTFTSKFIPLLVFTSLCKVCISTGKNSLINIAEAVALIYVAYIILMLFYMLILRIFAKVSPLVFMKKHFPHIINSAVIMSSNAYIPKSMEECEQLGVPKKIYSFSVPLGATIHKDGSNIAHTITVLACAHMCGVTVTSPSLLINFLFSVFMLGLSTPSVPGVSCGGLMALLSILGLPADLLPVAISINSLIDMGDTACNICGDIVSTIIVSAREKMLNMSMFEMPVNKEK